MPQFSYSAYDVSGRTVKGELSAENEMAALDQIGRENLTPIDLREGGAALKWWQRELSISGNVEARPVVLARFFQMFSTMLHAKYPITKSLAFCGSQMRDPKMCRLLAHALRQVEDGDPLAVALEDESGTLPARYLRMIETGEASNQLASVVQRIAAGLDDELRIRREITQALVYPIILIIMSILVVALLVFYLTPTLMPVFLTSQASPPFILSSMDALRTLVIEDWSILLLLGGALVVASYTARSQVRALAAKSARYIPGLSTFIQKRQSLTFCQSMMQFLSAGDRVQTAINQTKSAYSDPAWLALLQTTHDRVVDGQSLGGALDGTALLDPMALAMIEAGEEGDQLAETLQSAVSTLSDQTKQSLAQAVRLITPLLTLVIGLGVGAVIMSTISAILDLNDIAF